MVDKFLETMKEFLNIIRYRLVGLNILLIPGFVLLSFETAAAVPVLFLLATNLFDILGYHFTLIRREEFLPEKIFVKSYRFIQFMFDVVLVILLGILFGWIPALCGALLKMFALQDLMYYIFLRKDFPETWTWLWFTPLGIFKKKLSQREVLIQAFTGIIITTIILFYKNGI